MDSKQERLTKAITAALSKYKSMYDTRSKTVVRLLANQLAKDILAWYQEQKEKDDSK